MRSVWKQSEISAHRSRCLSAGLTLEPDACSPTWFPEALHPCYLNCEDPLEFPDSRAARPQGAVHNALRAPSTRVTPFELDQKHPLTARGSVGWGKRKRLKTTHKSTITFSTSHPAPPHHRRRRRATQPPIITMLDTMGEAPSNEPAGPSMNGTIVPAVPPAVWSPSASKPADTSVRIS